MTGEWTWLWWPLAGVLMVLALVGVWIWRRGRPFAPGAVFSASRLSPGNRLFPTQVAITPTSVVHFTPGWIGKQEESIHIAHIASIKIDTHLLFSNVFIETTGGASPIRCYGHHKGDAVQMKALIERNQNEYYRLVRPPATPAVTDPASR